jgi:hypothetical protein
MVFQLLFSIPCNIEVLIVESFLAPHNQFIKDKEVATASPQENAKNLESAIHEFMS